MGLNCSIARQLSEVNDDFDGAVENLEGNEKEEVANGNFGAK